LSTAIAGLGHAGLLLVELSRAGIYRPSPGWRLFLARVAAATCLMGWSLLQLDPGDGSWQAWPSSRRIGHLALLIGVGVGVYAGSLWLAGFRGKHFQVQVAG
jgi:putative peptidoglycan lipid II flippase